MKVELISYSNLGETVCGIASKTCVSENMPDVNDEVMGSLKGAMKSGHESVLEHWSATFAIEGISRACSHQLVRHRIASYSQQSQRYVNMDNFEYVTPESIDKASDDVFNEFLSLMDAIDRTYQSFIERGIPEEDARYILPNACCTNLVVTMNARSLRHFFKLRLCRKSQWEIRELAEKMLECVKGVSDVIFEDVGPACEMDGKCPERKPCNKQKLQVAVESKQAYKEDGIEDTIMDVKG